MVSSYFIMGLTLVMVSVLGLSLLGLSMYLGSMQFSAISLDKIMAFECGFIAFKDSSSKFSVSYYLLGMLFLMFDLEVIQLLPWVIVLHQSPMESFLWVYVFMFLLTIGFMYEWVSGALTLAFMGS